jgi:hypothetical protein
MSDYIQSLDPGGGAPALPGAGREGPGIGIDWDRERVERHRLA